MKENKKERFVGQEADKMVSKDKQTSDAVKLEGNIPQGIEILVKKASIDSIFRAILLEKRAEAAKEIELSLNPSETIIINTIPREQLDAIIDRTFIEPGPRAAFMGKVATLMIIALSVAAGCKKEPPPPSIFGNMYTPPVEKKKDADKDKGKDN
jgi:hypothetical protein